MTVSAQLLAELVSAHENSQKLQELKHLLIKETSEAGRAVSFRYGAYNVTVEKAGSPFGRGFCSKVSILQAQDLTPEPKCEPKCELKPYVPCPGQYFRVELKSSDRSYCDSVFRCTLTDNGVVVGRALNGFWKAYEPRIFRTKDVDFFYAYGLAKELGLLEAGSQRAGVLDVGIKWVG